MISTKAGTCRAKINPNNLSLAASNQRMLLLNVLLLYLLETRLQAKEMECRKAFWVLGAENGSRALTKRIVADCDSV